MGTEVIRNVRPLGAAAVDVVLDRATIEAIVPAGSAPAQLPRLVDGQGQLLLPALVESHVHFDKTLWGLPWRPNTAGPTRNDRIANEQRLLPGIDVPIARARRTADRALHRARVAAYSAATSTRRRRSASGTSRPCSRCARRTGT